MAKKTKVLMGALVLVLLAGVGLTAVNTDLLQGKFAATSSELPDLLPVPSKTSLVLSGEVGIDSEGNVLDYDVTFDSSCTLKNKGSGVAEGPSVTWCHFLYETADGDIIFSNPELWELNLAAGATLSYSATRSDAGDLTDEKPYYIDFFQDLYDSDGLARIPVEHSINYDSSILIDESDFRNNDYTHQVYVTDSRILWVER